MAYVYICCIVINNALGNVYLTSDLSTLATNIDTYIKNYKTYYMSILSLLKINLSKNKLYIVYWLMQFFFNIKHNFCDY